MKKTKYILSCASIVGLLLSHANFSYADKKVKVTASVHSSCSYGVEHMKFGNIKIDEITEITKAEGLVIVTCLDNTTYQLHFNDGKNGLNKNNQHLLVGASTTGKVSYETYRDPEFKIKLGGRSAKYSKNHIEDTTTKGKKNKHTVYGVVRHAENKAAKSDDYYDILNVVLDVKEKHTEAVAPIDPVDPVDPILTS